LAVDRARRAFAMHNQRLAIVLLDPGEIVVDVDDLRAIDINGGSDPLGSTREGIDHPVDHPQAVLECKICRPSHVREVIVSLVVIQAKRGKIRPDLQSPSLRRGDRKAVIEIGDPKPSVATAGVDHQPDPTRLVSLRFEEVVSTAKRADLIPGAIVEQVLQRLGTEWPIQLAEVLGRAELAKTGRHIALDVAHPRPPELPVHCELVQ
jgi:hypothetical protein